MNKRSIAGCLTVASMLVACGGPVTSDDVQDITESEYPIRWTPKSEADWHFETLVDAYQALGSMTEQELFDVSTDEALAAGTGTWFTQSVKDFADRPARDMAVEITMQRIPVPYDEFMTQLPATSWGVNLAHYLGGELQVVESDSEGRPTRQIERMVLSPFPCDFSSDLTNNDMTKLEIIEYEADSARVIWRVMHSDNNSTLDDVGSVEFRADGDDTMVTFHSAHRVNALGGVRVPSWVLAPVLPSVFLGYIDHYADLAQR